MVGRSGRVVAFEPSPRERVRLLRHIRLNKCVNVRVESSALGRAKGRGELFVVEGKEDWCNSLRLPSTSSEVKGLPVSVTSLDDFLSHEADPVVDFIKLDVEGAELDILMGSELLLRRKPRPFLLAEVQDIRSRPWGYEAREVIRFLVEKGFKWFAVAQDGSLIGMDTGLMRFDGNFVACPEERQAELEVLMRPRFTDSNA